MISGHLACRSSCFAVMSPQGRVGRAVWFLASHRTRALAASWLALLVVGANGCINAPATLLERLSESRQLAADLLVQFTKGADAANRAVMADTDQASVAFAREAEQATQAVQRDTDALRPILVSLDYSLEARLLEEFASRFAEYRALDRSILALAVENTNLKAQRLSFGPAQKAADAFRDALEAVAPSDRSKNACCIEALVARGVASVREIQVLQGPHIAEADDAAMTRIEKRMATSEASSRAALRELANLVPPESRPQLAAAAAALDQFTRLNAEILGLSRRNSNVRSLALSLGRKRTDTARCEESLGALRDALAKRGFTATR
jgi:hypothetical protein